MNFVYSIQYLDFFFFVNKKKLFFSIDLCVVLRVSVLAKGTHPQNLVPDLEKR